MEPPMNADGFARFAPFRPGIEHRLIDNLFISIELFTDGHLVPIAVIGPLGVHKPAGQTVRKKGQEFN
jgi:hypothetical protein